MNTIIDELLILITDYLPLKDKISIILVDKNFNSVIKNNILKNTRKTCINTVIKFLSHQLYISSYNLIYSPYNNWSLEYRTFQNNSLCILIQEDKCNYRKITFIDKCYTGENNIFKILRENRFNQVKISLSK